MRIEIVMNNSAGIFQVDDLLATKLRGTPLADDIEVVAEVEGEAEKRLLTEFRILDAGLASLFFFFFFFFFFF